MRKLTSSLSMGLLTWAMVTAAGCGQEEGLDFSQLPLASEAEDMKSPSARLFTWTRPGNEQIRCVRAPCPIAFINDVNLGKSQLLYGYDWRALNLSPEEKSAMELDASKLLLYGKYAMARMSGESVLVYQVTRANPRVSEQSHDRPEADSYYMVKAAEPGCQQARCGYSAVLMNRQESAYWGSMDLGRLGLPDNARQILITELQKGSAYVSIENPEAETVVVTEAFRPHTAPPLPNN